MNKFLYGLLFISQLFWGGCKKDHFVANNTATLNVINGVIQKDVKLKINGGFNNSGADGSWNSVNTVYFGTNAFFYAEAKSTSINILNQRDSSSLVFKNFDLKKGGVYTLALAGVAPNVDAVLIDDSNIPLVNPSKIPSESDSVINIRFINLSPDVQPLDIRLQGSTTNEVGGLAYKGYTAFKAYPAKVTNYAGTIGYSILNFEILENGNVIKTHTLFVYYLNRFKNIALVFTGMKTPGSGQPALDIQTTFYNQ